MNKIEFTLTNFPDRTSGYHPIAYTEGKLTFFDKNNCKIFQLEGVLLIEFALIIKKWMLLIDKGIIESFIYNSMDFEEEPVLAFMLSNNSFLLKSEFLEDCNGNMLDIEKLKILLDKYLEDLSKVLAKKFDFNMDTYLNTLIRQINNENL